MADSKISALTELAAAPASGDLLVLVDVSDTTMAASGTDKKITYANLTSALVSGATTFATSSAQTFTNGIVGPSWKPAANSVTAMQLQNAAGSSVVNIDTTNTRVGFGTVAPLRRLHIAGNADTARLYLESTDASNPGMEFAFDGVGTQRTLIRAIKYGTLGTQLEFFTKPDSGSGVAQRLTIDGQGYVGVGVSASLTALIHIAASTTARASACVNVGTAPTTPVAGDIWNDGALSFYNADATTNAIVNHLRLSRDSTGTAAAGLGLGILAELESTTTSRQSAGRLTWEWATATHASRAAKGKLTAYYTSTEREAITWVADSAGVKVGINQPSPTALLHLSDSSTSGTQILFVNSDTGGKSYLMLSSGSGNEGGAGKYQIVENASGNRLTYDGVNNRLGIGTTTPQSLIHMHDGSGGFLFVNQATVGGTLVTVIPDAAGDVTEKIFFVGWCTNSAPFSADVAPTTLAVSSSTTKTDGTNTLTIAVTAGGAFTLQATGGAATWNVNLWVFWR